jgi:hypothetical protein
LAREAVVLGMVEPRAAAATMMVALAVAGGVGHVEKTEMWAVVVVAAGQACWSLRRR